MYELTVKQRLRRFAEYLGMDISTFERESGAGKNNLRGETDPSMRVIIPVIQKYPQLSPDWLLTGTGSMLRQLNDHPSATTVPGDSSSCEDHACQCVAEPTAAYHGIKSKDITLPVRVYEEILNQLKKKDQQLEDAAAQIRTLFEMINSHNV